MHFNNVGYILVVQTEQEIQRHSQWGRLFHSLVHLQWADENWDFCSHTTTLYKPGHLFNPKLFALQLRPLQLKDRDSQGRVKKNTPVLFDSAEDSTSCLSEGCNVEIFPEGSAALASAQEISLDKRPVYMSYCRDDLIKMSGRWVNTDTASTQRWFTFTQKQHKVFMSHDKIFNIVWKPHSLNSFIKTII